MVIKPDHRPSPFPDPHQTRRLPRDRIPLQLRSHRVAASLPGDSSILKEGLSWSWCSPCAGRIGAALGERRGLAAMLGWFSGSGMSSPSSGNVQMSRPVSALTPLLSHPVLTTVLYPGSVGSANTKIPFVLTGGRRNSGSNRSGSDARPPASSVPTGTARYCFPSTA